MPTYDPHLFLTEGMEVEVIRGPLAGTHGRLIRKDGRTRLVLVTKLIQQTAVVEIHPADVAPVVEPVELVDKDRTWFYSMTFFLPREIRSPALDHVLEDRERLTSEGYRRWLIELITLSQCLGLLLHACWGFVWDVLNPFKGRVSGDK